MTICDKMPQGLCASPVIQGKNVGHGEGTTRGAKGTRIITSLVPYVLFVVPPCTSRQTNSLSVQGQYIKRKTSEASLQHSCLSWGRLNEDFVRKSEGRSDCVQIAERFESCSNRMGDSDFGVSELFPHLRCYAEQVSRVVSFVCREVQGGTTKST